MLFSAILNVIKAIAPATFLSKNPFNFALKTNIATISMPPKGDRGRLPRIGGAKNSFLFKSEDYACAF